MVTKSKLDYFAPGMNILKRAEGGPERGATRVVMALKAMGIRSRAVSSALVGHVLVEVNVKDAKEVGVLRVKRDFGHQSDEYASVKSALDYHKRGF